MKTTLRPALAALLAALLLVPVSARAADEKDSEKSSKEEKQKPAEIAVFALNGPITETPTPDDPFFGSIGNESLKSLVARMDQAAEDDDVAAAVVLLGNTSYGYAQMAEIRDAMDRIKKAGKPIYSHADSLQYGGYVLLSGASRLSIVPHGDLWATGLYGEQLFIRGMLDKLGVTPDFLTCGDYKSAGEMFMRSEPSPEAAEMYKWLFDGLYESTLKLLAEGRGVDVKQARQWVDAGLYSAEAAHKEGLIDAVESRIAFEEHIKAKHGEDLKFNKKYGRKKGQQIDFNNPFAMFQIWAEILAPPTRKSTKDAVAVVYLEGPIMHGAPTPSPFGTTSGAYSTPLRKALREVADDDTVKAVVLRVDSPGGSAVASDIILAATKEIAKKKPFLVSMGNVAGSGGYYVSCGTDTIYADEATITGSIGVIAGKLVTTDMWKRWGINFTPIQRGENASLLSSYAPFTDAEEAQLQGWMDEVYDVFKGHVTAIRGEKLAQPIDEIAGGRVYTGRQALDLGLVDKIGGLDAAIADAVKRADLEEGKYEVRIHPRPKSVFEQMFADLAPKKDEDDKHLSVRLLEAAAPALQAADPDRIAQLRQALRQLDIIQKEGVMLTMPILDVTP